MTLDLGRYRHPAIRQLAEQQVRFAPVSVRMAQLERTELLALEAQPNSTILYPELFQQITGRTTDNFPSLALPGDLLLHDLRCFVEDLSESMDLDSSKFEEPVLTQEEIAKQFNVSLKTVIRWRDRGLVGRWAKIGNRRRVCFLKSHVDRYVELHREQIERGTKFSQVTESELEWIIRRARRLARFGATQTEIANRLARRLGRAVETIRYTIKKHDADFPHAAVFANAPRPLTEDDRQEIYLAMKRGLPPSRLARQFQRTRSSIYRIAKEYRIETLTREPFPYVHAPEFDLPDADAICLVPPEGLKLPTPPEVASSSELSGYLSDLYEFPVLTREEEHFIFRKMNYLRHKARQIQSRLPRSKQPSVDMDAIDRLMEESLAVKNLIIRCNLRLVVAVARKHRQPGDNFFELVSDGNMTLIRTIELFDFTRGNKFSTYATWSLMRKFARSVPSEGTQQNRFRTGTEELLQASADQRGSTTADEARILQQRGVLEEILDQLDEREQEAMSLRFALRGHEEAHSLEDVGSRLGVTKERARQIIANGLKKLRDIVHRDALDESDSDFE